MADGTQMPSKQMVKDITWWTQGHTFSTTARVLDLKCYDIVLGMDWLEQYNPMWIRWKRKKMRFTHKSQRITLTGVKDCVSKCTKLKVSKLKGLLRKGGVAQLVQLSSHQSSQQSTHTIPPQVEALLQTHSSLFQEPTTLPPTRSQDHSIPLLPSAQPVNVKPYRYSPTQR